MIFMIILSRAFGCFVESNDRRVIFRFPVISLQIPTGMSREYFVKSLYKI